MGACRVLRLEQSVHGHAREADQVDRLGVPLDQKWERLGVEAGKWDQVSALGLVGDGALNLDQGTLLFVDKGDPGDAPKTNNEAINGNLNDLSHDVVHKEEV